MTGAALMRGTHARYIRPGTLKTSRRHDAGLYYGAGDSG